MFYHSKFTINKNKVETSDNTSFYKLPFIGTPYTIVQNKLNQLCNAFCKNSNIKLIFCPVKIGSLFSTKDPIPSALKSLVIYKFICTGCNTCYIGEARHHYQTRIKEHLKIDKASHTYKHLNNNLECKNVCNETCFRVIDSDSSRFRLKVKEARHISWLKPYLNKQVNHVGKTISV